MINFYFTINSVVWTDIIQALAAIIGIYFLVINLDKTNKILSLQTIALRNSQRPIITAAYDFNYLPKEIQTKECFPLAIRISNNALTDLRIELNHGPAIDFSITETRFGEQKFYYPKLEIGERIVLRYKVNEDYLHSPTEWTSEAAMYETLELYSIKVNLYFQDDNGFRYSQKISFNADVGHDPVVHRPEYL